jgi:uncharacterized DUF497 family protein
MRYTWDEPKRLRNLRKHGVDFVDAWRVFSGPVVLHEDRREDYGERRMIAYGLLDGRVVAVVHVESDDCVRLVSMRWAEKDETDYYYKVIGF